MDQFLCEGWAISIGNVQEKSNAELNPCTKHNPVYDFM